MSRNRSYNEIQSDLSSYLRREVGDVDVLSQTIISFLAEAYRAGKDKGYEEGRKSKDKFPKEFRGPR